LDKHLLLKNKPKGTKIEGILSLSSLEKEIVKTGKANKKID
jgi:hypothetical protein